MDKEEINRLVLIAARWEAICEILDGNETSEFMMSFPEVSQVADLYNSPDPHELWAAALRIGEALGRCQKPYSLPV